MFASRIDHKERLFRKYNRTLEFIWKPSENTELFTHISPYHYSTPIDLKFNLKKTSSDRYLNIINDPDSNYYNFKFAIMKF